MFPPSLHKNIRELDKQITLLESECENMESEKRGTTVTGRLCLVKAKEPLTSSLKRMTAQVDFEKPFLTAPVFPDSPHNKKNMTQLHVTKLRPKNSVHVRDMQKKVVISKEVSTATCDEPRKKTKNSARNCTVCGSGNERPRSGSKKDSKTRGVVKCACVRELSDRYEKEKDNYEIDADDNENHVLHKGILHANPGAPIEVTVTQKSFKNPSKEKNIPTSNKGLKCKVSTSNNSVLNEKNKTESHTLKEKHSSSANEANTSPIESKWSEILSHGNDSLLLRSQRSKKFFNSNNDNGPLTIKNLEQLKFSQKSAPDKDELKVLEHKPLTLDEELMPYILSDENKGPNQTAVPSSARKSVCKLSQNKIIDENDTDFSRRCLEKQDLQKGNDECGKTNAIEEFGDTMNVINDLVDIVKASFSEDAKKCITDDLLATFHQIEGGDAKQPCREKVDINCGICINEENDYVQKLRAQFWNTKRLCDKLIEEKEKLSKDLAEKDRFISDLNAKEKDYLSVITSLKLNLEKNKIQAQDNVEILKELNEIKNKLLNETKISDALRKSHSKLQEQVHKCVLENDKLKTQIRLNKLESQKYCVLIAGKDAEIKRYKDEVESFQRQITDQLAALRSSSATNEVQKAMEAIMQHSLAISTTDLDSDFSDTHRENRALKSSSKQRDRPIIHSSPTSTKSSVLDSSWNHISSIHDADLKSEFDENVDDNKNKENMTDNEVLIGGHSPSGRSRLSEVEDVNIQSFISCKSADDLSVSGLISRLETGDLVNGCSEKSGSEALPSSVTHDLRRDIEELFNNIKIKCSKKLFALPNDSLKFDDILNSSQTSDLSEFSGSLVVDKRSMAR